MRRSNIDISFWILIILLVGNSFRSGGFSDPKTWILEKILLIPAIIIGLSFHEFGHAVTAYKLGDPTPKMQGRVTVNPLAHIDWVGLVALFFAGFGWGIPVQINPYNFRHRRRDEILVAVAGVVMNLIIAIVFTLVAKAIIMIGGGEWIMYTTIGDAVWKIVIYIIQINLILMIFNLIPVPPLDGFNIIANIFGFAGTETYWRIYRYGTWILVAIILFGIAGMIISPAVNWMMDFVWRFLLYV